MKPAALLAAALVLCAQPAWPASNSEPLRAGSAVAGGAARGDVEDDAPGSGVDLLYTSDSDGFRSARARAAAFLSYASPYDFTAVGAGGTRYTQRGWSIDRYTVFGAVRDIERATGAGLLAIGGLSSVGDHQRLVAEASWNKRMSDKTGIELVAQRDFVETRTGLESGTMTNFLAGSLDRAVTERLTLIGLAGVQYFSDDNWRAHLRGRAIFVLLPEQGLGVQVRARTYESSASGPRTYFNPERYDRGDIGLRLRRAIGDWRVLAAVGGGRERINRDAENPTRYADVRAERTFAGDVSVALSFVYQRNSDSESATGGGAYTWRYFRAVVLLPF